MVPLVKGPLGARQFPTQRDGTSASRWWTSDKTNESEVWVFVSMFSLCHFDGSFSISQQIYGRGKTLKKTQVASTIFPNFDMVEEESYNRNNKEGNRFETHTQTNAPRRQGQRGPIFSFLPLTRGSLLGLL